MKAKNTPFIAQSMTRMNTHDLKTTTSYLIIVMLQKFL